MILCSFHTVLYYLSSRLILTSIKAKTKQILSNLRVFSMSFCHQVPWSIQQWAQISPSLLFTETYLQKPFLFLSLARSSSAGTWFSKPFPSMFRPCLYTPSKSPVLSSNSFLHLACKLQQLLVHPCKLPLLEKIRSSRASPFTGSLIISVWNTSAVLLCLAVPSLPQISGQVSFSEIQHCSSKSYSLNYRLLDVHLWMLYTRSQTTLSLIDIWDHQERWC